MTFNLKRQVYLKSVKLIECTFFFPFLSVISKSENGHTENVHKNVIMNTW